MSYIADLHIHSYLSRACSKNLHPESLYKWCQLKGISVLATGDFTHPKWFQELQEKLTPDSSGFFKLKPELAHNIDKEIYPTCRSDIRFTLGVEISSIYKKNGRVRKVHNLVFAPSFEIADKINKKLDKIGNIKSDGRPILGLDSKNLLSLIKETSEEAYLIPAHAWTPHFAVFGSESGFDSLEECFEELTPEIFAIETGLSSDPLMNRRLSALDPITLISNSDAHSPEKLAREANVFTGARSYKGMFDAMKNKKGLLKTLEFFPEEGKYHEDGHRKCQTRMHPKETIKQKGLCPKCGKKVTVGVLHRVQKLADRDEPKNQTEFENIIPLKELIGQTIKVGPSSIRVDRLYHKLLNQFGNELFILRELPLEKISGEDFPYLALALKRMRTKQVDIQTGYDGEYGVISTLKESDFIPKEQLSLF